VPFSDAIALIALITNEGNEPEAGVGVSLTVVNVDTGEIMSRSEVVTQLDPGTSTTVRFDAMEIEPGGLYQANLTARINGDIDLTNNDWTMTFIWNAES
jgi:autotransporter translocation and assembly factor TamB